MSRGHVAQMRVEIQTGAKLKDAEAKTREAKAKKIASSGFKIQSSDSSPLKFFMP